MWGRPAVKYLAGLLLAGILLAWVLRGADLRAISEQFRQASLPMLALCAALNLGHTAFRVWRWRALLEPVRREIPFRPMFDAVILGYWTSWVVPGRLGELVRPALLAGRQRLPLGPCLGSVVSDRLLDAAAMLALFTVGLAITPLGGEAAAHAAWIRGGSFGLVGLFSLPLLLLLLVSTFGRRRQPAAGGRIRARLARMLLSLAQGTDALRRPRLLFKVLLHSMLAWTAITVGTWIGIRACGVEIPLGAAWIILPLLALGIALPTPGGAGGYHAAMIFGLTQLFAVPETLAVGAAFLVHAVVIVPFILLGSLLLLVERLPFHDLLEAARQLRGAPASSSSVLAPIRAAEKAS